MPELPEVESLARYLTEQASGRVVERVDVAAISALKTFDPPVSALHGRTIDGCGRRGKFLVMSIPPHFVVLHLARGGWVKWVESMRAAPVKPGKGPLALRIRLDGGTGIDVTEAGTEKRLAVHVVDDPADVEGIGRLGPDPLTIDEATFVERITSAKGQIKKVLTDQEVIAGVGNAYSDEALHIARLSPFRNAEKLEPGEAAALHAAVVRVLTEAVERARELPAGGLKSDKKSNMRVHGRTGQPCPECGDVVREVSFATKSLQYCATCQTSGKPLADRRLSRLLK